MENAGSFRRGMIMPTLITQLKSILKQYPDDGQILKELIQNAEDAGASNVAFLIDYTTYGTDPDKLHHKDLAKYQGPALYAYNNAVFSERDWEGIRRLQDSIKADDPLKVGKFGLGFKSIFHITDLPSIYSGYNIGFIDPHKRYFEVKVQGQSSPERTSSYDWNFKDKNDRKDMIRLSHQFEPFLQDVFGVNKDNFGYFNGTMFRFPLRNSKMHSDLSNTCYGKQKITQLIKFLKAESEIILLFLKKVENITFYEKEENGSVKELLSINISGVNLEEVRKRRKDLCDNIRDSITSWHRNNSFFVTYPMEIIVESSSGRQKSSNWHVCQQFAGKESRPTENECIDGYLPLVGVASKVPNITSVPESNEPYGQMFCFLPLPIEEESPTGFNFHVHGSFAVDQNRRHIKWASGGQDLSQLQDKDLIWNKFLIEKVLPDCLNKFINYLIEWHTELINENENDPDQLEMYAQFIYSVFPDRKNCDHHWSQFVESFNLIIIKYLTFFSASTLTWKSSIFYLDLDISDDLKGLCRKIMSLRKKGLACLPSHVIEIMPSRKARVLDADELCWSYKTVQEKFDFCESEKILLLEYFFENIYHLLDLIDLHLLPLSDGTWTCFDNFTSTEKVYVSSDEFPQTLFPNLGHKFLCLKRAPDSCKDSLDKKILNLHRVDNKSFIMLLKLTLNDLPQCDELSLNVMPWFSIQWLQLVWTCIRKYYPNDLFNFMDLPLIFIPPDRVLKLNDKPAFIGTSLSDRHLPEPFEMLCQKLGVVVVESHKNKMYNHLSLWRNVILPPRMRSVLTFLVQKADNKQSVCEIFRSFTPQEIEYFVDNLASEISDIFTSREIEVLKTLEIFPICGNKKKNSFVCINDVDISTNKSNTDGIPVLPYKSVLNLHSDSYEKLAQKISSGNFAVRFLDKNDLIEEAYFPGIQDGFYSAKLTQLLMQYICKNIKSMKPIFINRLKELRFVSTPDGGALVRAKDLFDYSDETLIILLEKNLFPKMNWRCPEYYEALILLGLKTVKSLKTLDIANVIENLSVNVNQKRFKALLGFLDENHHFLNTELKSKIANISWVPIKKQKPDSFPPSLPFYGENLNCQLARYDEVFSSDFEKIIGSVCPVVDSGCCKSVQKYFGWDKCLNKDLIFQHLQNLVSSFNGHEKFQVSELSKEIYKHLNEFSSLDFKELDYNRFPWVWVGDSFARVDQVVMEVPPLQLLPYCFPMPSEIKCFSNLWQTVGVSNEVDLTNILKLIKCFHEKNPIQNAKRRLRDVNIAVNILNHFSETNSLVASCKLLIPVNPEKNSPLKMELLENCVYCDKDWYRLGFSRDDLDENLHFIHKLIPIETAERLGVPSCKSKMLNAEELDNCFGQSESLTARLRGLIKDYTDGLAVLKELIQNADDANATEVNLVYDERDNSDARTMLLDENMEELQGPAIWCHNNATFTKEDFQNITKLGGATKEHSQAKVGKFGLGFNSVYNLTDVPAFVSNNSVVFFDPHTKYLGKALVNKSSPGFKLDLSASSSRIKKLKNQFKPFNGLFGCDFSKDPPMKNYAGTLFRFPLRTKKQAQSSEICQKHYDRNEVIQLLNCLNDIGDGLLMFTQNVTKITVYHIAHNMEIKSMKELFSISKNLKKLFYNSLNIQSFSYLDEVSKNIGKPQTKKKIEKSFEFVFIMQTSQKCNNNTAAGLGLQLNSYTNNWMVSWCTGVKSSLELYNKKQNWLPIGAAAAKLEEMPDGSFVPCNLQNDQRGYLYCFLPLLTKTQLPVHINGYFLLNSSRTQMYMTAACDKNDERGVWNEALLQDAVALSYCYLLKCLASIKASDLYSIFPSCLDNSFIDIFAESVFSKMLSMDLSIFKSETNNNWFSLMKCSIIGIELKKISFASSIRSVLKNVAKSHRKPLLDIPEVVLKCILKSKQSEKIKPLLIDVGQFFKTWFLENLNVLPFEEREEVIVQTLISPELCKYLSESKCIPVTPSGSSFEFVSNLVDPSSILGPLYDEKDGKFPYTSENISNVNKIPYLKKLKEFGMRTDSILTDEIVEKCQSIENNPSTMAKRLPILLQLINDETRRSNRGIDILISRIKSIRMFPLLKKPNDYLFSWKTPKFSLVSCDEGFLEEKKLLAGPSHLVIDESRSFNGEWQNLKNAFNLTTKLLPFQSLMKIIDEVSSLFNEKDNHALIQSKSKKDVLEIMEKLYQELKLLMKNKKLDESHFCLLYNKRFVLVNDKTLRLFLPEQCSTNISLLPYLCSIKDITLDEELVLKLGIKDTFSFNSYQTVLIKLEKKFNGKKLDKPNLTLSSKVLRCICELITNSNQKPECDFYVPNMNNSLCLASQLKFNNCSWTPLKCEESCHTMVSWDVASKLGIKSFRQDVMDRNQFSLPFGQREELINRINRILIGYPLNEDILKEMLQNADDAGATEIHFIKDARQLPDQKIFGPQWKPLQGPSLSIYNNKSFTLKDLKGIQNLGEGSKQNDITKTGQYGVGFNSVYHLTDVPSFLTTIQKTPCETNSSEMSEIHGTVLCIFDPNCKFLSEANFLNPGALYKVEAVSEMFTDVYKGYLQDIPAYRVSKEGTVFRLPLRNDKSKENSKLSGDIINLDDLSKIFTAFKSELHQNLFFLKSLDSLTLAEIKNNDGPVSFKKVQLRFSDEARREKIRFVQFVRSSSRKLQEKSVKLVDITCCEALYEVSVDGSLKSERSEWIVVQRFGFDKKSTLPQSLCENYERGKINLQPCGGVAFCTNLLSNGETGIGRVFNFLPLPITTHLPFHINGHFVMSHESRKGLWEEEHKTFKSEWNDVLISQIIVPAFCSLLCYLKEKLSRESLNQNFSDKLLNYYKIFPNHKKDSLAQIRLLTKEVYKYIFEKKLQLFLLYKPKSSMSSLEWTDAQGIDENVFFDDLDQEHIQKIKVSEKKEICRKTEAAALGKAAIIRNILFASGMKIINCPILIFEKFQEAGIMSVKKISSEIVLKHLSTSSAFVDLPKNICDTIFENSQKLKFFLEYTEEEIHKKKSISELTNLPFLLTSDNVLHKFKNDSSLFRSKHKNIAPHKWEKFINSTIESYFSIFLKILRTSDARELLNDFRPSLLNYNELNLLKISDLFKSFENENLGKLWIKSVWEFLLDIFCNVSEFKSKLIPLQNFCIIPATIHGKTFLYPLFKASCIRNNTNSQDLQEELSEILSKIGVPLLNFQCLQTKTDDLDSFIKTVRGDQNDLENVLSALEEVLFHLKMDIKLDRDGCLIVLKHVERSLKGLKINESTSRNRLKKLPFYTNMNNQQVSLNNNKTVYVFPSSVPEVDSEKLECQNRVIFLKSQRSLLNLFKFLNCEILSETDAYMKFIFKEFQYLDESAQLHHLEFLRDYVRNLCSHPERKKQEIFFFTALKEFCFIRCSSKKLQKASHFYVEHNRLFKLMETNFLPSPFNSFMWEFFLTECGLVTNLTQLKFIEYARQVMNISSNEKAEEVSALLVLKFNNTSDWMKDKPFLTSIESIPFILSPKLDEKLVDLFLPFNSLKFMALKDSNLFANRNLCWTVSTILPDVFADNQCLSLMNVRINNNMDVVFNNMQRFSVSFNDHVLKSNDEKRRKLLKFIKDITEEHLDFLSKNNNDIIKKNLSDLEFIYVESFEQLVRPFQLATDITEDMQILPYLVKLPSFYGKYENFLAQLGATKRFTLKQYAWALEQIKNKVGSYKMDPDVFNISIKLLKRILTLLSHALMENDLNAELMELKYLYLPCKDKKLYQSNKVACVQNMSDLLKRLKNFDKPLLVDENANDLMKLPEHLKPKLLSDLVQEQILNLGKETCLQNSARKYVQKISHEKFVIAVEGIWLRSQDQNCTADIQKTKLRSLHHKIECITFCGVEKIETHLLQDGRPINGSNSNVEFYFETGSLGNIFLKVYLTENAFLDYNFVSNLSNEIINYCEIRKSDKALIENLLHIDCDEIDKFIENYKLVRTSSFSDPALGNEIMVEDHFRINQDFLIYRPQQLVAYEVTDPLDTNEDGEAKYILVEVVHKIQDSSCSRWAIKYKINFGNHTEIVVASKLYEFKPSCNESDVVVVYDAPSVDRDSNSSNSLNPAKSLKEALDEMKTYLKEIWVKEEDEKRKLIKRMFLRYHPDKNPDNINLTTELFKHLQILIKMLEDGKNIDNYGFGDEAKVVTSETSKDFSGCYSNYKSSYYDQSFFDRMKNRARQQSYYEYERRNNPGQSQHTNFQRQQRNNSSRMPKRCPEQAELWMKQAEHDYETAMNDDPERVRFCKASAQWRCNKYYRAAQNSITAVHYARDSSDLPSSCDKLVRYCSAISDQELLGHVNSLDVLLRNKNLFSHPHMSATAFTDITKEMAEQACEISQNIMTRCRKLIELYKKE